MLEFWHRKKNPVFYLPDTLTKFKQKIEVLSMKCWRGCIFGDPHTTVFTREDLHREKRLKTVPVVLLSEQPNPKVIPAQLAKRAITLTAATKIYNTYSAKRRDWTCRRDITSAIQRRWNLPQSNCLSYIRQARDWYQLFEETDGNGSFEQLDIWRSSNSKME